MIIPDRCEFAHKLVNYSDCALDISDGLVGDLRHILERSCVGARIDVEKLPKPCEFSIYNLDEKYRTNFVCMGAVIMNCYLQHQVRMKTRSWNWLQHML